jgi:hypothetical protein
MNVIITAGTVVTKAAVKILQCAEEGIELQCRDHTNAETQAWEDKCKKVFQDTDEASREGTESVIREKLTGNLLERGFNKRDAERMVEHQMEHLKSLYPKVKIAWTFANKMAVAAVTGMVAFVVIAGTWLAATKEKTSRVPLHDPFVDALAVSDLLHQEEAAMNNLIVVYSAPMAVPPRDIVAAMPAPVAAIAAEPVAVEITTPDEGTHVEVQTLGQVYQAAPPSARRQIEQEAPKIDHGYDHPDPHSCVATDCLDQHRDQWNRDHNSQEKHKEIDITNGDGSARIRVQY